MAKIKFSNEDIKSGFLVQNAGRYNYECLDIKQKPARTDGSPNYLFTWKGLTGEMEGVTVFSLISSKAQFLLTPIFRAANGGNELDPDTEYDLDDLKGVVLSAMTTRGQNQQGQYQNTLGDWQPAV